jgi:hypothetical protein
MPKHLRPNEVDANWYLDFQPKDGTSLTRSRRTRRSPEAHQAPRRRKAEEGRFARELTDDEIEDAVPLQESGDLADLARFGFAVSED